jgi:membrane associated rhomboid family serine protease
MAEKKAKKELTATQTKNKYRALQYTFTGCQFLSIIAPYVVIGAVNFDEYFVYNTEGWKVGTGGTIALALMGFAVFAIGKKKDESNKYTNGYLTLGLLWLAIGFLFFMLSSILGDMAMIMVCGSAGIFGALGLNVASENMKNKADLYKKAIEEANKDGIKNKVAEEAKKKVQEEFPTD